MSDFQGMEDLLQDFLVEATDLLSGVDNKLVDLEKTPGDRGLLNEIFRGFHTIKGGAGFLNAEIKCPYIMGGLALNQVFLIGKCVQLDLAQELQLCFDGSNLS